jgi:hypothetical protein
MDKMFVVGSICGLSILACGGGSNNQTHVDANAGSSAPVVCTAQSSYGAASIVSDGSGYAYTAAEIAIDGSNSLIDANQGFSGNINADATPDEFEIDLYEGFGAFGSAGSGTGNITTGNFTLAGDDLSFQECGLCLQIYTDLGSDGSPTDLYFATGGTVDLTSVGTPTGSDVSTGTLAGSLSNVTFAQWDGSDDVAIGSCTSSITSLSFSGTLVAEPSANSFVGPVHIVAHRTR